MELTVIKILLTTLVVVLLAEVSKRTTPVFGGILLGLPLGVGLSVYFISYAEGVPYFVKGIPWGLAGLAPSLLFCLFYLIGGRIFKSRNRILAIAFASALGLVVFFAAGFLVGQLKLNMITAAIIFVFFYFANIIIVRRMPIHIGKIAGPRKTNTIAALLARGLISGIIIAGITGIASLAGSVWAGLLSAFPSTTYALVLVLHYEERDSMYPSIIYGFSHSVSTLAVFYILCWQILPRLGLNIGFVVSYVICIGWLFVLKVASDRWSKRAVPINQYSGRDN